MPLTLSRLTREYVKSDLTSPNDLSTATCEWAFMPSGDVPEELDWHDGDLIQEGDIWVARILVGDGTDVDLVPSPVDYPFEWQAWLRVDDNPERPVRRPGIVEVE